MRSERWQRHDLLRVHPGAWAEVLEANAPFAVLPHVKEWATRGWPVIVRRLAEGDQPDLVPVGLPLPPTCGKRRLAMQIDPDAVCERLPAQPLRDARRIMPGGWQSTVDALLNAARREGVEPNVFGSVLWQWLTGLTYLSPTSDLDLLWPVQDLRAARALVQELEAVEATGPVRFDGEVCLPDGSAVQWRELLSQPAEILWKTMRGAELRPR